MHPGLQILLKTKHWMPDAMAESYFLASPSKQVISKAFITATANQESN
jgi:hypothetical protein